MLKLAERIKALPKQRKLAVLALLALWLFAAEALAAWHQGDLKSHSSDEPCKICLSLSGFTSGNVATTHLFVGPTPSPQCQTVAPVRRLSRDVTPQRARGPPIAS